MFRPIRCDFLFVISGRKGGGGNWRTSTGPSCRPSSTGWAAGGELWEERCGMERQAEENAFLY